MAELRVAVVDDCRTDAELLEGYCLDFCEKKGVRCSCEIYGSGLQFIDAAADFDLVFLDVEMPDMDGIKTAGYLRRKDTCAEIVFVTGFAQFALAGYKVEALDYIVKPCDRTSFDITMDGFFRKYVGRRPNFVSLRSHSVSVRIPKESVLFVESRGHWLLWHTDNGDIETWGNMSSAEKLLGEGFARCNVSMLVNVDRVSETAGDNVVVGGYRLRISRLRKKEFCLAVIRRGEE